MGKAKWKPLKLIYSYQDHKTTSHLGVGGMAEMGASFKDLKDTAWWSPKPLVHQHDPCRNQKDPEG